MPVGSFGEELRRAVDRLVNSGTGPVAQKGTVNSVSEDGTLVATVDGKIVRTRLATEEPILPGESVWIAKTRDGSYVVHGGSH